MAKRLPVAELHRSSVTGEFYTRIISGNGYDVMYHGETIKSRVGALKSPRALASALKPYFLDYTTGAKNPKKVDLLTDKPYVAPKNVKAGSQTP